MESMRQDVSVRDLEPVTELEFPALVEGQESARQLPNWLANLQLLWENRGLLYRVALWALVLSLIVAFLIPSKYESTTRIMPPDSKGESGAILAALMGKAPGLSALAGDFMGVKNSGALYVDLLRSRTVQENIVDRFDLQKVYWKRYKQDTRKLLDNRTDIAEDRKSGTIALTVTDRDPQRARDIAQEYVEQLNRLLSRVNTSSARRERIFIEERMTSVKSDLEDAEKQFSAFASKNATLDMTEQAKAMVTAGASLQGELIVAQAELEGLQTMYTDNNVRVRAARARIDELKRQLQKMGGSGAALTSEDPAPGELYPPIRKLPLLGVQWADLYRRMKIQEKVFELLNQQYELARIEEAKEIPTVKMIDPANLPEKKSWPPRLLIISLLTVLSLAGAILSILESARIGALDDDDIRKRLVVGGKEKLARVRDQITRHMLVSRFTKSADRTDHASF
jgi:capsule polysaccharide export protein KpsE/RkpR